MFIICVYIYIYVGNNTNDNDDGNNDNPRSEPPRRPGTSPPSPSETNT